MSYPQSRREFLKLSSVTATSALFAGCSAIDGKGDGLVLGSLAVRNAHPDAHTVRVELERAGELVTETTVEVEGDNGVTRIDPTWPSTPAVYTLRYVIVGPDEDPDIRTRTLTSNDAETDGHDCSVAAITMGFPDESRPYVTVGPPESLGGTCPE